MKRIVLVACSAGKADKGPMAAQWLYTSQLFNLARNFAQKHSDRWFILSAKYGLLEPNALIHPYNEGLKDKDRVARYVWAQAVIDQFDYLQLAPAEITILAGRNYRENLMPMLEARGHRVRVPMEGLGIGKQLQFLTREVAA